MDQELMKALKRGDRVEIKKLAVRNPNVFKERTPEGNNVLHMAARMRNAAMAQAILDSQDKLLYDTNLNRETPMHFAARAGDISVINQFISCMNRVENKTGRENILIMEDSKGNTPLHNAVRNGHLNVVQKLTAADPAPILHRNTAGESPLSIAVDADLTDIARWIVCKDQRSLNYKGILHSAVSRQNYDFMVEILNVKPELIKELDGDRRYPLHHVAVSGHVEMAQHLIKENVKLAYKRDCNGQTPLHLAAEHGRLDVLKMLLNDCQDAVEVLDNEDRNILHLAARYGKVNIVSHILELPEMEDFINSPDKDGNTPLHLAAMYFHTDVVLTLSSDARVKTKAINHKQLTALAIVETAEVKEKDIHNHKSTLKALKMDQGSKARGKLSSLLSKYLLGKK